MYSKGIIKEELGIKLDSVRYKATIESFFTYDDNPYHEINIVHQAKINDRISMPTGFFVFEYKEMEVHDIRPEAIKDLILDTGNEIRHIVLKE